MVVFAMLAVWGILVGALLRAVIFRLTPDGGPDTATGRCAACGRQLPWHRPVPLLGRLGRGGGCPQCAAPTPYPGLVEALGAGIWLALWARWGLSAELVVYGLLLSWLLAGTIIDLQHRILPDATTLGALGAGILACAALPRLQGVDDPSAAVARSLAGAAAGGGILLAVRGFGDLAFGRRTFTFTTGLTVALDGGTVEFGKGPATPISVMEEALEAGIGQIRFRAHEARLDGEEVAPAAVRLDAEVLTCGGRRWPLEAAPTAEFVTDRIVLRRGTLGMGDVKLMAAVGAFCGWPAVAFTLVASSVIGALTGSIQLALRRLRPGRAIPYGPFIALAALAWILVGRDVVRWWLAWSLR